MLTDIINCRYTTLHRDKNSTADKVNHRRYNITVKISLNFVEYLKMFETQQNLMYVFCHVSKGNFFFGNVAVLIWSLCKEELTVDGCHDLSLNTFLEGGKKAE
jgi:hypothetical protein